MKELMMIIMIRVFYFCSSAIFAIFLISQILKNLYDQLLLMQYLILQTSKKKNFQCDYLLKWLYYQQQIKSFLVNNSFKRLKRIEPNIIM